MQQDSTGHLKRTAVTRFGHCQACVRATAGDVATSHFIFCPDRLVSLHRALCVGPIVLGEATRTTGVWREAYGLFSGRLREVTTLSWDAYNESLEIW